MPIIATRRGKCRRSGLDKGEKPWVGALRELEEETGIAPHLVEKIVPIILSN